MGGTSEFASPSDAAKTGTQTLEIRVRGAVQGVGFRPMAWRLARDEGLVGHVINDGSGVLIQATASARALARFLERMEAEAPPLARIESVETQQLAGVLESVDFSINESAVGENRTRVTADASICPACREEVLNPSERRYRYPFANCTQ